MHVYDQDDNDSLDPSELKAAIEDVYPRYVWPADYWLSMESIRDGVPTQMMGDPVSFEVTYAFNSIGLPFGCAWMSQYMTDLEEGNSEDAAESLTVLRAWTSSSVWAEFDQERWQGGLDEAELGDPSVIRQFVNQSCSGFPFEANPTATAGHGHSGHPENAVYGVISHP